MNRRSFLSRISTGLAGAALAVHLELGSLAPVLDFVKPAEKWWYLIEETLPVNLVGAQIWRIERRTMKHVRWIDAEEMTRLGLKHEDFVDNVYPSRYTLPD
jgi:hypothetical protein